MTFEKYISEPHMCNCDYTLGTSELGKSLNLNKNFLEHDFKNYPNFQIPIKR